MTHKVIINTCNENRCSYERGTLTLISGHSDSIVTKYSIWSDTEIEDENIEKLIYHVFLESLPAIHSLQDLVYDEVEDIIHEGIESHLLTDIFKDGHALQNIIYWSNQIDQPLTIDILPSTLSIDANQILVEHMVCDTVLRDVSEGITSEDLLILATHVKDDWDIFSDTPLPFLNEIVNDFLDQVTFTSEQMSHIRNLQRVLLMDDNVPIGGSSFLYKDTYVAYQVLEHKENNQSYYRLCKNDYERSEYKILKYAKTLAEIHSFYEHYVQFAGVKKSKVI